MERSVELKDLKLWDVEVKIELRGSLRDPEGETILRDLLRKRGVVEVEDVRSAKLLRFKVRASSKEGAEDIVKRLCDDLRLYNPVSHTCKVKAGDTS